MNAIPILFQPERCRLIRAEFAAREHVELIAKYRALLTETETALREPRMAWLAERIRDSGGARTYLLLVQQGARKGDADEAVAACGVLLGNRLFARAELRRFGVKS